MHTLLAYIVLLAPSEPTEQPLPTLATLQAALEAIHSATEARKVTWVSTPFRTAPEDASPDHPDRLECKLITDNQGRWFFSRRLFQGDSPRDFREWAYDGRLRGKLHEDHAAGVKIGYLDQGLHPGQLPFYACQGYLMELDIVGPIHERFVPEGASVIGYHEIDGTRCIRVEVRFAGGFEGLKKPRFLLDLDPQHGFRARRIELFDQEDAKTVFVEEVLDFQLHGDIWFPKSTRLNWQGEVQYYFIVAAEFNTPASPSAFQVSFPTGTRVSNRVEGKMYIVGGDAGQKQLQDAYEHSLHEMSSGTTITTKETSFVEYVWKVALFVGVVAACGVGFLLWRRRFLQGDGE